MSIGSLAKGEIADVQLRFALSETNPHLPAKLQYRRNISVNNWACQWSKWVTVPITIVPDSEYNNYS